MMRDKKSLIVLAMVLAIMLAVVGGAAAITNGELDGEGHPMVGLMVAMDVDYEPLWRCSGTLISPTVFLTAGHCTEAPAASAIIWFDPDVEAGRPDNGYPYPDTTDLWFGEASGITHTHPQYDPNAFYLYDLGVVVLEKAVWLDEYGTLPELDVLDEMKKQRGISDTSFTAVGYGFQFINPVFVEAERVRMVAYPHLVQINAPGLTGDYSLLLSNNHSTGGTCFGDSGGPNFINDGLVVGGVTSFGLNGNCRGTGGVYRVDRADDLDWLATFLP